MIRATMVAVILLSGVPLFADAPTTAPTTPPAISGKLGTPVQLFNGKDLTGWSWVAKPAKGADPATLPASAKIDDVWSVTQGVLHDVGKPAGYVHTDREFS